MEAAAGAFDEKFRCRRTGDRGVWRCKLQAMSGKILCQKHWLEYERRKERKKLEKLNKLREKENGGGSNSGDVGGNGGAMGMEINRVFDGIGTSEGQRGVIPGEIGGEGVDGVVKEKEIERPSGSEIRKELELMQVRSDVSREGEGSKNKKKITVENNVEGMQMGGDAGGDCSGVRGKKRGRPKGSKNRKKSDVEAMQMGIDIGSEGGGVVREKKKGIPMDSENCMKIAAENESVGMKVGDASSEYGDEVVVKKDDVAGPVDDFKKFVTGPVGDVSSEFYEGIFVKKGDESTCMGERKTTGRVKSNESLLLTMSDAPIQKELRRSTCHLCLKSDKVGVIVCSNCNKKRYCYDCIEKSQNSPCVVTRDDVQNGAHIPQADSIVIRSKKLQDDMQELGQKIKHHDDNVKYLKALKNKVEESIVDMQVAIGKYYTRPSSTENEDLAHMRSEEETIQNILKHEKSAAALLCWIRSQPEAQGSYRLLTKDVVGIVATLGKVDDDNLSRLLSEYLGLDTMLAVVCRTYEGVTALEAYNREGLINKSLGIHALGSSTRRPLDDRFIVICLEKLRPYYGEFIADDPQQRLDLQKPKLLNGEIPPGFLGFAVNMITIDNSNLSGISNNGCSLRETLFYNLFTNLQVYRSREDMLKALACITNGAISLDGGIIKGPGMFSLGQYREGNVDVMFPNGSDRVNLPASYFEIENCMKETEWKKTRTLEDMQREQALLDHARYSYEIKKREFVQFLAESSSFAAQVMPQSHAKVSS